MLMIYIKISFSSCEISADIATTVQRSNIFLHVALRAVFSLLLSLFFFHSITLPLPPQARQVQGVGHLPDSVFGVWCAGVCGAIPLCIHRHALWSVSSERRSLPHPVPHT